MRVFPPLNFAALIALLDAHLFLQDLAFLVHSSAQLRQSETLSSTDKLMLLMSRHARDQVHVPSFLLLYYVLSLMINQISHA